MTYTFRSITPGFFACIPVYALFSNKCSKIKVYDTDNNYKIIDRALLKDLYSKRKLAVYKDTETGKYYIPSKSYMKYI